MKAQITVRGWDKLDRAFRRLPEELRKKVLHRAAKVSGDAIRNSIRDFAPVDHGILRKHIIAVPRKYQGGKTAVAIVGPERKVRAVVSRVWHTGTGETVVTTGIATPSKYAHLVEYGFYSHLTRTNVRGTHFMRKGTDAATPRAQALAERVIEAGILAAAGGA